MQNPRKTNKAVQEIQKPILIGSWHGRDAYRLGRKLMVSILTATLAYLLLGTMLSFNSLPLRILFCGVIVALPFSYLYFQGLTGGQNDAAFAEIMYQRQREEKPIDRRERERCFHPAKGYFAALIGALPFVAVTLVFAVLAKPMVYTLGTLPAWIQGLARQSEFGDALRYYDARTGMTALDVLRIACRAMVMPFINVAVLLGDQAVLWTERLSPLLVLIAPLGFGIGYRNGVKARARINTSIAIGDEKKRRKERKERKRRARSDAPERLI